MSIVGAQSWRKYTISFFLMISAGIVLAQSNGTRWGSNNDKTTTHPPLPPLSPIQAQTTPSAIPSSISTGQLTELLPITTIQHPIVSTPTALPLIENKTVHPQPTPKQIPTAQITSTPSEGYTEEKKEDTPFMQVLWKNGVYFESADKDFIFHVGGTVQYDFTFFQADSRLQNFPGGPGPFNDAANLRRGRLRAEGTLYQSVDFLFELEFFNGFSPAGLTGPVAVTTVSNSVGPTDAHLTIKEVPLVGNIRIGSQKEPFSLEHLNSYRYLEFLERSYLFDAAQPTAFNNGFTPGISVFRTWMDDRFFSAIGVFKNESDLFGFGLGDGNYAVTGRLTALPIYLPDEEFFWHIGGAMSHRDPVNDQVQVRVRNSLRNAPFPLLPLLVNSGLLNASTQDLFNLETAAVYGPWTFQSEYLGNRLSGVRLNNFTDTNNFTSGKTIFLQGSYIQVLYFLTGESRTWNPKAAVFNRVIPKRNLRKPREGESYYDHLGAWEIGIRYTYLDATNNDVLGGRLDNITLGLNWYLNPNAKLQFNYDFVRRGNTVDAAQGDVHGFGIRSQFDF